MDKPRKPTEQEKQRMRFLLGCIRKIAAAANVELSEATLAVYIESLSRLTDEQVEMATSRTISEWPEASKMPPLKFILDRAGSNSKLLAEQAWELAIKLVKRDWYADGIGWVAGSQEKLGTAIQYAIRQCGGEHRIAYATEDSFPFIRRTFLEAHERFALEGGEQVRLTHGQAEKLLEKLRNELE